MEETLSLYETLNPVNTELKITYTPSTSIVKYTYEVYKDDELFKEYVITSNKITDINLLESGKYKIVITEVDNKNSISTITSGIYNVDMDKPVITVKDPNNVLVVEQLKKGEELDLSDYVIAYDKQDGDISDQLKSDLDQLDLTVVGVNKVIYNITDSANNTVSETVTLNVIKSTQNQLQIFQFLIIGILLIILRVILLFNKSISREKRISKYSVESVLDKRKSIFDKGFIIYQKIIIRLNKVLNMSEVIVNYSNRKFTKYVVLYQSVFETGLDVFTAKIILAFLFLLVAIFSKTIQYEVIKSYEIFLPLVFGYLLPNVILISKYKIYRNKLENDILQAIIIMNNAFKSGRSIIQAIQMVSVELDGTISNEFNRMYMELSLGLSLEIVFERFSSRINIEEVAYLTASLTVLNKTGGNIIKVFSSIEKSLFNKKKLKLELSSLTGSSKLIIYVLSVIPLLFVLFVSLISPTYFEPFYNTMVGLILAGIMLIIYIVYVYSIRKIMKVRM